MHDHHFDDELHHGGPPRIMFSMTELGHLAASVVLLTMAFTIVMGRDVPFPQNLIPDPLALLASFLAVSSGFVIHELAHKIVAQRMGHWAEYRAQFKGLGLSLIIAALANALFAAPGAVLIQGRVTARENGIISLVGPASNLVIALIAWPFSQTLNPENDPVAMVFRVVAYVNALLAIFNMIPAFIFDGRKVWWWSKPVYIVSTLIMVTVFILILMDGGPPRLN